MLLEIYLYYNPVYYVMKRVRHLRVCYTEPHTHT